MHGSKNGSYVLFVYTLLPDKLEDIYRISWNNTLTG